MLSHRHSEVVNRGQLAALPPPPRCGPHHRPVPHLTLVEALQAEAITRGYTVTHEQLAINRGGRRLFGVMDLARPPAVASEALQDRGLAIGFRNSTDTTLAINLVAGQTVHVCDNLVLSGDLIALQRKNTTRLELEEALQVGFDRFQTHADVLDAQIGDLQGTQLTPAWAKWRLFDIFAHKVLPLRLFHAVSRAYFHPTDAMTDCQPRTLWGLHNACTRSLKALPPARAFTANIALGQAFGLRQRTQES